MKEREEKEVEDKKRKLIAIVVFGIIGIILGTTSAWYTWVSGNTNVTLNIGGIQINYQAGTDITGRNLRPVSTKEVGVENNYAIKKDITVSASKTAYFSLYLNAEVFGEGLKHESLKWELYEGSTLLNSDNFSKITQGDKILLLSNAEINSTTRNLSLYIWIDGNMGNPSGMQNQEYKFVLNAEATTNNEWSDNSGANHPDLMDGMVPVRYKKCGELEEVTEELYPECYGYNLSEEDIQAIKNMMCTENATCELMIDVIIEEGSFSAGGETMTVEDLISMYESNGGVFSSSLEKIFNSEKVLGLAVALENEWYNYDNQQWANAVLVNDASLRTALPGTLISEENILAHYVWIPRYKYKLFNASKTIGVDSYNAKTTGIDIVFERGTSTTGTVSCTTSSIGVETCENAFNGNYYTHPAFTFGDKELRGIWVGKFEVSAPEGHDCASYDTFGLNDKFCNMTGIGVRIKPNAKPRVNTNISNFFIDINNMTVSNNEYGLLNTKTDSHMIKNDEYGALAYLTNSIYGRCADGLCKDISINYSMITGSSLFIGSNIFFEPLFIFDNIQSVNASSTGNFYGVYDLNGGGKEYTMGNMMSLDETTMMNGESGFYEATDDSTLPIDGISYPNIKYYDVYAYGETLTDSNAYLRGRLGDATGEVVSGNGITWNNGIAQFIFNQRPWFVRGGDSLSENSGIFAFEAHVGNAIQNNFTTTRAVLVSIE